MTRTATQRLNRPARDPCQIRLATDADNNGLLELTRRTPMNGRIALRIDRDPDFFALVRDRGHGAVFVALRDERVVGSISIALRHVYTGGTVVRAAYIADLKADPDIAGTRVLLRLFDAATRYSMEHDILLVWCLVASGNERVLPLLSGRLGLPRFVSAGRFCVDELLNIPWPRRSPSSYVIDHASDHDEEELILLRDSFHRTRELALVEGPSPCHGTIGRLVARHASGIVAALEIFDPGSIKRNVLLDAPLSTRILLNVLRPVCATLRGPPLPRIGEPVRLAYIRRFACDRHHTAALASLIDRARSIALKLGFTFTAFGVHERDPFRRVVAGLPRFSFSSHLYVASLRQPGILDAAMTGVPIEDYSFV
jgi:hypothetical protein